MTEPETHSGHRARLRQRFLNSAAALAEVELLELVLTFAIPRADVLPQVQKLLEQFGSLDGVLAAPYDKLIHVTGIGEQAATLIKLVARLAGKETNQDKPAFDNTQQPLLLKVEQELPKPAVEPATQAMSTFGNDEVANSLIFIPQAAQFETLETFKAHLQKQLPYNSESTRQRRAEYILERFFPGGRLDVPLTYYAAHCASHQDLQPAIFYHMLSAEPIAAKVAEELVWPALPLGCIEREAMRTFVLRYLPNIGTASQAKILRSLFNTYTLLSVGVKEGTQLRFQAHAGTLAGFLYVLTAEFSEPGIYTFEAMENGPLRRWLLWDREWMRRQLYNLRDLGIAAKVSEIDTVRQFTLPYDQMTSLSTFFEHPQRETLALRDNDPAYGQVGGKP